MKKHLLFVAMIVTACTITAQNDCNSALPITEGVYTVDAINGTEVPDPNCSGGNNAASLGEWFEYTPTDDFGVYVTSDLVQNAGGDTRLHIYTGSCGSLSCLTGDDDAGVLGNGFLSIVSFNATAGETYYIAFDNGWSSDGFDFELIETDPLNIVLQFTPVSGGAADAIVDMDNDGRDDLVEVTNNVVTIRYQQADGSFETNSIITSDPENDPSWSIAAGDLDANGYTDLLYGGGSGVTFMMASDDGTSFEENSGSEYVFSQRSNMVDINNDGHLDAFVCHDVQPNVYYINDGEGNLSFFQGGLGDTPDGGNYGSIWIDYNNDCLIDLFIAKCRGGNTVTSTNQMHKNLGGGVFEEVALDLNLADPVQTWSSAWGDFDNDGDMDVFVGASSSSAGSHRLMRNDGDTFTDVTIGSGFDTQTGLGIENATQDFNNDGYIDILGAGGALMLNNGDMSFEEILVPISNGPIGDINGDGNLDVGTGDQVFLNQGVGNNYLRIHLQGVESNSDGIGARIQCVSALGTQIRDVRAGEGFRYMSSTTAHFGIAQDEEVEQLLVHWPSGTMDVISNPQINTTLTLIEGNNAVGLDEYDNDAITVFPSVTTDIVNVRSTGSQVIQNLEIYDSMGKQVAVFAGNKSIVNVSELSAGQYIMRAQLDGGYVEKVFVKR